MAKIFIFGNPHSPLVSQRGRIALRGGHQVDWFWATPFSLSGVRSFSMPGGMGRYPWLRAIFEPLYLKRALNKSKPDLVHVHYASRFLSAIPLGRRHPLVVTVMGSDLSSRGLARLFTRWLLDRADVITTKSTEMDHMTLALGNYGHKLRRIRWGTDLDLFSGNYENDPQKQKLGITEGQLVFFDPRAARPLYNKHLILEAFRNYLSGGGQDAVLLVSKFNASREYLAQLVNLSAQLGLDEHVRFVEPAGQDLMARYYSLADVVISIPDTDGFPQTIYEAWASGCFLILGDLPQYKEAVEEGKAALLVSRNVKDLANALFQVQSAQFRLANRQAARAYVAKYADAVLEGEQMLDLYNLLLRA